MSRLPLTGVDSLSFFLSLRWKSVGNKGVRIGASLNWENVLERERERVEVCLQMRRVCIQAPTKWFESLVRMREKGERIRRSKLLRMLEELFLRIFFFFFFPFGGAKWIKYNGSFRGNEYNVDANDQFYLTN